MRIALLLVLFSLSFKAHSSPAEERPEENIPILDTAQEILGARANYMVNRLDSFFATERADDELGRSRIRIRSNFEIRERATSDLKTRYRINLRLPSLEERFKWEYNKDGKKKLEDQPEGEVAEKLAQSRIRSSWIFNSDMGINVSIPPKLVTRARLRRNFFTGPFIHRFVEQLTYTTDASGLVEETRFDSDHVFHENLIFRFINVKTWEVLQKDFTTAHGPTLIHRLTEDDALNYGFTMSSVIDDGIWFVDNYRLYVNYRRNVYRHWVYFDVTPGIDFPKHWSFRRTPFMAFQLELLFGGV